MRLVFLGSVLVVLILLITLTVVRFLPRPVDEKSYYDRDRHLMREKPGG